MNFSPEKEFLSTLLFERDASGTSSSHFNHHRCCSRCCDRHCTSIIEMSERYRTMSENVHHHSRSNRLDQPKDGCRITTEDISYINFPGKIFVDILKMLILPLIVSSIISSLAKLDAQSAGKMGARALVYYLSTTLIAAIIGIVLVLSIRPGSRGSQGNANGETKTPEGRVIDTILDLFRFIFQHRC